MPSKSGKQVRFMAGITHGMKPKSSDGPPRAVAEEYNKADAKSGKLSKAITGKRRGGKRGS